MENIIILIFHLIIYFSKTNQHILDECHAAAMCVHDGKPVCASNDIKEHRMFLDSCDMHEYNCDYGTDYNYIEVCLITTPTTITEELTAEEPAIQPTTTQHDVEPDFGSKERLKKPIISTHQALNVNKKRLTLNDIFKCPKCLRPQTWETTVRDYENK